MTSTRLMLGSLLAAAGLFACDGDIGGVGGQPGGGEQTDAGAAGTPVSGGPQGGGFGIGDAGLGPEVCGNGLDDDGNGKVDENCACSPTTQPKQECYPGPAATKGVGQCKPGTQACVAGDEEFATFGECVGAVLPSAEDCTDGIDNDCNGKIDAGPGCLCKPGATQACYSGAAASKGVGQCKAGKQTCNAAGTGWGTCQGEVLPGAEDCGDGVDNDCNGKVDDGQGCLCKPGATKACYSGPAGTNGVGQCKAGKQTCNAAGTGWSGCQGEVLPAPEICNDAFDNDCNGQINQGCAPVVISVNVNINGDCVWANCPPNAPFPVACNIAMGGDDCRGCVGYAANDTKVYFQEGNNCGSGWVKGTLSCSNLPGAGLSAANCNINKGAKFYSTGPAGCPKSGGDGCGW